MIREFKFQDRPGVVALITEVLGAEAQRILEKRWDWLFAQNPFNPSGGPPFLVTEQDGNITGVLMSFSIPAYWQGKTLSMFCIADFAVHPSRRGIGLPLAKTMIDLPNLMIGSPNKSTEVLWRHLGSLDWGKPLTLTRILDLGGFLEKRNLPGKKFLQLAWEIIDHASKYLNPSTKGIDIQSVEEFPPDCDALWKTITEQGLNLSAPERGLALITIRDQKFLNWRFAHCPMQIYHILLARREGKLTGYTVLRCGNKGGIRRGYVVDQLTLPSDPDTAPALLQGAVSWFKKEKVQAIHCLVTDHPSQWIKVLVRCGFWFRKRDHVLIGNLNLSGLNPQAGLDAAFRHISFADGELDFVS